MTVGTIFAFPAWPEDMNRATLARVTAIEDSTVHFDLFACTGRAWKQAVFKKVFVDDKGALLLKTSQLRQDIKEPRTLGRQRQSRSCQRTKGLQLAVNFRIKTYG